MPALPTDRELQVLPLRALVAYAVRCAQRVQPHFEKWATTNPKQQQGRLQHFSEALQVAHDCAAGNPRKIELHDAPINALVIHALNAGKGPAANAAHAAAYAVRTARTVARYANPSPHETFPSPDGAATLAAQAASAAAAAGLDVDAARQDYERLMGGRLGRFPELGQPIVATAEGPLGPV
jgi:hypothetical protein